MNQAGVDGDERGRFMKNERSVALPRAGVANFYVIVPSLGIMLIFAAAAYAVTINGDLTLPIAGSGYQLRRR
jgi:hypothetical protein